jgi:hypothetical protein
MSELILVDAPFRTMQALYGNPPFVPPPDETIGMSAPICTPSRGDNSVREWYAEQEARHGLYAALKAKRPKRNWFGGRTEEQAETVSRERREKDTLNRVNFNMLDWAPPPASQPSTALIKPVNAVAPTAKPLEVPKRNTLASDDDGKTWFVVIDTTDNTVPVESENVRQYVPQLNRR